MKRVPKLVFLAFTVIGLCQWAQGGESANHQVIIRIIRANQLNVLPETVSYSMMTDGASGSTRAITMTSRINLDWSINQKIKKITITSNDLTDYPIAGLSIPNPKHALAQPDNNFSFLTSTITGKYTLTLVTHPVKSKNVFLQKRSLTCTLTDI